jgi:signal transduction histidine kinase
MGGAVNTLLPLNAYTELLQRWLRSSDAVEREAVLLRVDEMAQLLLSRLATQDELINMHHEAQSLLAHGLQAEGWPSSADHMSVQGLQRLASGDALTPLLTLLLPLQLERARRIKHAEEALYFNDMMRVTTLASGVAHDFNNLLGIIIGLAELNLLEVPAESASARHLQGIVQVAKRGSAAVNDLHGFARSLPLQRMEVSLAAWLKGCQALLLSCLPVRVEMSLNIVVNSRVKADPARLEQVLVNLVKNAGYAMRKQGGQVRIILDQSLSPGGGTWARLRVIDHGEGIHADVLPHVFAPYFTTKPPGEGTGMGLSAAHGIIRQHEGTIEVNSAAGGPTVFTVLLPLLS